MPRVKEKKVQRLFQLNQPTIDKLDELKGKGYILREVIEEGVSVIYDGVKKANQVTA